MKKYLIIIICCLCIGGIVYKLCSNHNVASLSSEKITEICKNVALEVAKQDRSIAKDLRKQRDVEKICECGAVNMPHSVTVKEFKKMLMSNDARMNDIMDTCIEQLTIRGVISDKGI